MGELDVDWDRMFGKDKSVLDVLNVWANQPETRVGRSPIRVVEDVDEYKD